MSGQVVFSGKVEEIKLMSYANSNFIRITPTDYDGEFTSKFLSQKLILPFDWLIIFTCHTKSVDNFKVMFAIKMVGGSR